MTSHGVPRPAVSTDRSEEARQKELKQIQTYKTLVEEVNTKVEKGDFSPELLQKTADLLKQNPEYYTVWNHRRRIYVDEIAHLDDQVSKNDLSSEQRRGQILDFIQLDLQFLFPLLIKFPKCYWIWNHRLWLLQQATEHLSVETSVDLWTQELGLVGQMLTRDSRNFHGWGYRRLVTTSLEELKNSSMAREEFEYTTKMIKANLSNFSAWHTRSKLILRRLDERHASDEERRQMLDDELALIHKALFDPYDQSLWFYHQNLMCTFDPSIAASTMAPNLSNHIRLEYLAKENDFIEEILEDTDDCKWIFQALLEISLLESRIKGELSVEAKHKAQAYVERLIVLDPLRKGRWLDMQNSVASS